METIITIIAIWLFVCGWIAATIDPRHGLRNFVYGFIFGPVGVLLAAALYGITVLHETRTALSESRYPSSG